MCKHKSVAGFQKKVYMKIDSIFFSRSAAKLFENFFLAFTGFDYKSLIYFGTFKIRNRTLLFRVGSLYILDHDDASN
jgi:hypothetical protein